MKFCAIGRFRGLAHAYLPHNHAEGVLPCASLAKKIAWHTYSSYPSLLSNPSVQAFFLIRRGQKEYGNTFIIIMLGDCFFSMSECGEPSCGPSAVSECGGIAIIIRPGQNTAERAMVARWVKMRRPERHKISHGIAAATGLQRTVRSCRGTIQAIFATFSAATGL